jgi:flagellar motility protein MotE (MotC chaperone)
MKELLLSLKERLRILPLLVVVASLAFVVRVGDAALQVKSLSGSAFAQGEPAKAEEKKVAEEAKDATPPAEPPAPEVKAAEKPGAIELPSAAPPAWSDAADADIDYSNLRKELYQDLLQRRQQLDDKEKSLAQREALLDAGKQEIDKKVQELTGLRDEIQNLLKKQTDEETARIASLVKIYEGMKPKDAARIFNTLDMDILLEVVAKMSERKSAPIIAAMDAERARGLTTMLAEQKKLPELPDGEIPPLPAN